LVLRSYGLRTVEGDAYSGQFVRELFQAEGIAYSVSRKSKSELYLEFLPCLNSGRVQLLDNKKLVKQLCTGLGTRRDIVDHPKGVSYHDDSINVAAGALCLAALSPAAMSFAPPIVVHGAPLGSQIIPGVIRDWPSNPLAPSSPEYQTSAGGLAQFAWSPNRAAPASPAQPAPPAPKPPPPRIVKHMTVSPDWRSRIMTMSCGALKWTHTEDQTVAGFRYRIEADMRRAHGDDGVISWPSELKEVELST
jgi:hypothetical protein